MFGVWTGVAVRRRGVTLHSLKNKYVSFSDITQESIANDAENSNASDNIDLHVLSDREHVYMRKGNKNKRIRKGIRYAGNLSDDKLNEMSPESLQKFIKKIKVI
ncbi:uncharacterized protein LOC113005242 [Solenopsis invicta]|uniref:uncharacterized protein LOC113005242 n=1 Tax=Solenopsis invicta TaxID=13686 RepID=UPI00193EA732|nr:uncharacterized protein LOC113005242 [Solenopsis invicta]